MARKYRYLYNFGTRQKPRWYLWAGKGKRKYRVDPAEPNFRSIYGAFLKGEPPDPPNPNPSDIPKPVVHTFGWGVRQFYKGHPFVGWKYDRQKCVRAALDPILEEDVNADKPELGKFETVPLDKVTLVGLEILRDRKLAQKLYGAAGNRVKNFKMLFKWLKRKGHMKENPAIDLDKIKTPKQYQKRHTWTDAEIAAYRRHHPVGTKARLAFELHYHYLARADVVQVGPANIVQDQGIKFLKGKRQKTGEGFKVAMSQMLIDASESPLVSLLRDQRMGPLKVSRIARTASALLV